MGIFQDYEKFKMDFVYLNEYIKNVISIFEGSGRSQIITKNTIKGSKKKIKDFIILSQTIENALNYLLNELQDIKSSTQKFSGSMFYFSRYGGSKTQFLNVVLNEIQESLPDCIVVIFNDISELNPIPLFNRIKQSAYYSIPNLSRFKNDEQKYMDLIAKLEAISADINVDLRQSSNLNSIVQKVGRIRKSLEKNPLLKKELDECLELIQTSILVDSELVVKKILDFMRDLSREGFIFLFLYDEVDAWLEEAGEQLLFSKKFINLDKIMKYIFESSQHEIKLFHLFACTERVDTLIKSNKYAYSESSSAASRFIQIYGRSHPIPETGNYGEKIEEALAKISAFFAISNSGFKADEQFLINTMNLLTENYKSYSRRVVNSQIIRILRMFHSLKLPLDKGQKEWENSTTKYGNLIQYHLSRILSYLNIKFIREDISIESDKVGSDKIDGYFINYDDYENEIRTYAEIKLTKKFTGDKAYQALQWSQTKKEPIIMMIFSQNTKEDIQKEIVDYAEKKGFTNEDTDRIKILNISNPYAFCPIIGVENVLSDHTKLVEFYNDYAFWMDFFGKFTYHYQEIKTKLGLGYIRIKEGEEKEKKDKGQGDEEKQKEFRPEMQLCMDLLVKLYNKGKMKKTGRLAKTTIENINKEYSLGISNLNELYEIMEKYGILTPKSSMIAFSEDLLNIEHLEEFVKSCENKFSKKKSI